jgi:hypothetical protein
MYSKRKKSETIGKWLHIIKENGNRNWEQIQLTKKQNNWKIKIIQKWQSKNSSILTKKCCQLRSSQQNYAKDEKWNQLTY